MGSESPSHWVFAMILVVAGLAFLIQRAWQTPTQPNPYASQRPGIAAFRNPANGYEEEVGTPFVWGLRFGFYFAVKGIWTHAIASFVLAILTSGLSWLLYPFFARQILRRIICGVAGNRFSRHALQREETVAEAAAGLARGWVRTAQAPLPAGSIQART